MKANQPTQQIGNDPTTTNNNKETNNMATTTTCPKCLGTGKYNVPLKDGSIGNCFTCKGTGTKRVNTNPMSQAQINLIRSLYKEVKGYMSERDRDILVEMMQEHIRITNGELCDVDGNPRYGYGLVTVSWASAKIDELKKLKARYVR